LIFIVGIWPELLGLMVSKWVIGIAAVVLLVHALKCGNCRNMEGGDMKSQKMPVVAQRKARRKK